MQRRAGGCGHNLWRLLQAVGALLFSMLNLFPATVYPAIGDWTLEPALRDVAERVVQNGLGA